MLTKRASYELAEFKADPGVKGEAEAIVSVFGNVDKMGDRVMPGAFKRTIAEWEKSGSPIPVIWSHDWLDPMSNIGHVIKAEEVAAGLKVRMKFDIDGNEKAAYVFRLLEQRRVKEFSFGYAIKDERQGEDKANELLDLDLFEVGPTLKGANPATELLATKSETIDNELVAALERIGLDLDALREMKRDPHVARIPTVQAVADAIDAELKAGARLSAATKAEMQSIHDDMNQITARMRALMSSTDEPSKSQEPDQEPTAKSGESESEPDVKSDEEPTATSLDLETLDLSLRIAEIRIPRN